MRSELGAMLWNCRPADLPSIASNPTEHLSQCVRRSKLLGRVWWWVSTNIATAATLAHTYIPELSRQIGAVPQRCLLGIVARPPWRPPPSCSRVFE